MKRLKTILTIFVLATLPALAQEDLKIGELFYNEHTEEFKSNPKGNIRTGRDYSINQSLVSEISIQGQHLKPYNLTLFRSVTFENGETMVKQIEEWIEADSRDAYDKEVGRLKGQLYYGFFCLPPQKGKRRYLFYRNAALQPNSKDQSLTVAYMEGYATLEQLKEMFK